MALRLFLTVTSNIQIMSSIGHNGMSRRSRATEPDLSPDQNDSDRDKQDVKKTSSPLFTLVKMVVCVTTGVVFGFSVEKSRGTYFFFFFFFFF